MKQLRIAALAMVMQIAMQPLAFAEPRPVNRVSVINDGIPGENSTELRARFAQEVSRFRPRITVIYTGMNDAVNDRKFTTLETFESNVRWMLDTARQAGTVPVLVTIQPVDEARLMQRHAPEAYGSRAPNERIADHNRVLIRIAKLDSVALVRFDQVLTAAGGPSVKLSPDGVHLYAAGYKLLADAVWRVISPQLKQDETVLCMGDSLTFGQGVRPQGEGLLSTNGQPYATYPQDLGELQLPPSHQP